MYDVFGLRVGLRASSLLPNLHKERYSIGRACDFMASITAMTGLERLSIFGKEHRGNHGRLHSLVELHGEILSTSNIEISIHDKEVLLHIN